MTNATYITKVLFFKSNITDINAFLSIIFTHLIVNKALTVM